MKRWKKIGICVIPVALTLAVGLTVWQSENLKLLYTVLTGDSKAISQKMEEAQHKQHKSLEDTYHVTVLPPSSAQSNALLDGKLSPAEVKDSLGISQVTQTLPEQHKNSSDSPQQVQAQQPEQPKEEQSKTPDIKPPAEPKAEQQKTPEATPPAESEEALPETPEPLPPAEPELTEEERQNQIDALVNQCVAELYACEVDLMGVLGEMKKAAKAEWKALPKKERTREKKMEIGFAGLDKCYELEVQVDEQVTEILDRYRGPLEALNADMMVLDELWRYYCDKKASQKAYYLEKYLD